MDNDIKCTCGHSWSKSSSNKKDMNVCHICGKDNTMKDGGWLSKYDNGGLMLEKKADNYGKQGNYNDASASTGPGFVGMSNDTTGRHYSPAWGGQFQMGGSLPGAVGFTYARTAGSAPSNGKYAKKTKASAQDGKKVAKKDLTEEQYYNPEKPTYKSGNMALDVLASNPWLMKVPILGDKIKEKAYQLGSQGEGSVRSLDDIKNLDKYKSLAKYTGIRSENNTNVGNVDLLKQYLYQDQGLDKSKYTPKDDYLNFLPSYSLKNKLGVSETSKYLSSMQKDKSVGPWNNNVQQLKDLDQVIKTHNPIFYNDETKTPNLSTKLFYNHDPNLGHYKSAFGYDEDVNLPYASISDAWDFYPKDYAKQWGETEVDAHGNQINDAKNTPEYQQSYLMHNAGKPFKVYDRVYIDPKTKEPISDKEIIPKKLEKKFTPKGLSERVTQELHKGIDKSYNPNMQNGGEMAFYQQGLDWKPKSISKNGSKVIKDDMGQWTHPGEITQINSSDITMQGVDYPVIGVSDTGDIKMMQPDENYKFKGKKVTEYPMAQNGGWLNKWK